MSKEGPKKESYVSYPRVFVVDDSELSRKGMISILEQHGYVIVGSANSAKNCLENVTTETNLFIVDVVMPETSGIDLAQVLSKNLRDIFIIIISSLAQEHIVLESISAGAFDFLQKPFEPKELLDAVARVARRIEDNARI